MVDIFGTMWVTRKPDSISTWTEHPDTDMIWIEKYLNKYGCKKKPFNIRTQFVRATWTWTIQLHRFLQLFAWWAAHPHPLHGWWGPRGLAVSPSGSPAMVSAFVSSCDCLCWKDHHWGSIFTWWGQMSHLLGSIDLGVKSGCIMRQGGQCFAGNSVGQIGKQTNAKNEKNNFGAQQKHVFGAIVVSPCILRGTGWHGKLLTLA